MTLKLLRRPYLKLSEFLPLLPSLNYFSFLFLPIEVRSSRSTILKPITYLLQHLTPSFSHFVSKINKGNQNLGLSSTKHLNIVLCILFEKKKKKGLQHKPDFNDILKFLADSGSQSRFLHVDIAESQPLKLSVGSKSLGYFHIPKIDIYGSTNTVRASVRILHYLKLFAFLDGVLLKLCK